MVDFLTTRRARGILWTVHLTLAWVVMVGVAPARAGYVIEDLGTLKQGSASSGAGVASSGYIVGTADQADGLWRAVFSGGAGGVPLSLGTLDGGENSYGHGVNSSGQVVGSSEIRIGGITYTHAFVTDAGGEMRDLGTLSNGGGKSEAYAISETGGYITGYSTVGSTGGYQAFRIVGDGQMESIGTLDGGSYSVGRDVNDAGVVTGWARTGFGADRAFLYTGSGGMMSLGTLPTGNATYGMGLNNRNEVVGYGNLGDGSERAFFWTESRGLLDLGTSFDEVGSRANDINERTEVVGFYRMQTGGTRAVLWRPLLGEVVDLTSLLPEDSGWVLTEAMGINDAGQIVGTGRYNGETRGFRLSPSGPPPITTPEPASLVLCALGGGLILAARRFRAGRTGSPARA